VRSLGLDVNKYFSIVFVIGSRLAVMGGVLCPHHRAGPIWASMCFCLRLRLS
jgi:branched-subunit amino acid ABC-type transport system permease component